MFSQRLKELREAKGLSQEMLAELLEIPRSSIAHYENSDDRTPRRDRLEKIANFFGVSIDYLLGRTDNPNPDIPPATELTEKDEKDIAKRMEKLRKDLMEGRDSDGLSFHGEPMSEEAIETVLASLEYAERMVILMEKRKASNKSENRKNE